MTLYQQIITIGLCIAGTMLTRFLPFIVFRENKKPRHTYNTSGNFFPLLYLVCSWFIV